MPTIVKIVVGCLLLVVFVLCVVRFVWLLRLWRVRRALWLTVWMRRMQRMWFIMWLGVFRSCEAFDLLAHIAVARDPAAQFALAVHLGVSFLVLAASFRHKLDVVVHVVHRDAL